jgi:hypothetical protein
MRGIPQSEPNHANEQRGTLSVIEHALIKARLHAFLSARSDGADAVFYWAVMDRAYAINKYAAFSYSIAIRS